MQCCSQSSGTLHWPPGAPHASEETSTPSAASESWGSYELRSEQLELRTRRVRQTALRQRVADLGLRTRSWAFEPPVSHNALPRPRPPVTPQSGDGRGRAGRSGQDEPKQRRLRSFPARRLRSCGRCAVRLSPVGRFSRSHLRAERFMSGLRAVSRSAFPAGCARSAAADEDPLTRA
ncbi:hypothetical protein AOLI_G00014900 [Acnodon oligacanthus]